MDRRSFLTAAAVSPAIPVFANTEEGFELPHVETFKELQEAVEKCAVHLNWKYNGRMGPKGSRTESGNPYITYCVGGPKIEGEIPVTRTKDPNQALRLWYEEIEKVADPTKQLVWRVWPQVHINNPHQEIRLYKDNSGAYYSDVEDYHIRARLVFE